VELRADLRALVLGELLGAGRQRDRVIEERIALRRRRMIGRRGRGFCVRGRR
jgi:hypothetical protein